MNMGTNKRLMQFQNELFMFIDKNIREGIPVVYIQSVLKELQSQVAQACQNTIAREGEEDERNNNIDKGQSSDS